jgi:ABC-2 type transport system permease protein
MNPTLLRAELRRLRRNRGAVMLAAGLPGVFLLVFASSSSSDRVGGLSVGPYVMVSMATFGAMNALFTAGGAIAHERATGWNRQLRVAGLRGRDYLVTKIAVAYLTACGGVAVVFVIGAGFHGVRLDLGVWLGVAVSLLVGLVPIAALGVAVGYAARPSSLQPVFGLGSALLALFGGLWNPIERFPGTVRAIVEVLPVYWAGEAGRAVLRGSWLGWHGVVVVAAWTVLLGVVAGWAYRRDGLRPSAAGAT